MNSPEKISNSTPSSSAWDSLSEIDFSDRTNLDHENKIISVFMSKDLSKLGEPAPRLSESERDSFIQLIRNGEVDNRHFKSLLKNIAGPMDKHSNEKVFSGIQNGKHALRILSYMTGSGFNDYQSVGPSSIAKFADKFETPIDFEPFANDLLNKIKRTNPEEKYNEYANDMEHFKNALFGKKQEYWDAIKSMQERAKAPAFNAEKYMEEAYVDGDPYEHSGKKYQLTPKILDEMGLKPKNALEIANKTIGFSDAFSCDGHLACIGYVPTKDGVSVCTYYRSNSSGSWRYLPDYVQENEWCGKGYNEESLTLPFEMQKKLTEVVNKPLVKITNTIPEFPFYGTAKSYKKKEDYAKAYHFHSLTGAHYQESSTVPLFDYGETKLQKTQPETVGSQVIGTPSEPNFKHELDHYKMQTPMYGDVSVHLYPSQNGELLYTVCETHKNNRREAWISGISTPTELTSKGTPKNWVSGGDIATPLYEYQSMSSGFGSESDTYDSYTNMWDNYLSKSPIIQKYLKDTDIVT